MQDLLHLACPNYRNSTSTLAVLDCVTTDEPKIGKGHHRFDAVTRSVPDSSKDSSLRDGFREKGIVKRIEHRLQESSWLLVRLLRLHYTELKKLDR